MKNSIERLYGEDIGSGYKPPAGILGTVLRIVDVFAERNQAYRSLKGLGKFVIGEETVPTATEFADSVYKHFVKRNKYAAKIDEIVANTLQDYISGVSEVPFFGKDKVEYDDKEVWGVWYPDKIEYLRAHKIKKDLGPHAEEIRKEVGLTAHEYNHALEHNVRAHELVERRLSGYLGKPSGEEHGYLQAKIVDYLRSSDIEAVRKIGEVGFRIDRLRTDKFGENIRKYTDPHIKFGSQSLN